MLDATVRRSLSDLFAPHSSNATLGTVNSDAVQVGEEYWRMDSLHRSKVSKGHKKKQRGKKKLSKLVRPRMPVNPQQTQSLEKSSKHVDSSNSSSDGENLKDPVLVLEDQEGDTADDADDEDADEYANDADVDADDDIGGAEDDNPSTDEGDTGEEDLEIDDTAEDGEASVTDVHRAGLRQVLLDVEESSGESTGELSRESSEYESVLDEVRSDVTEDVGTVFTGNESEPGQGALGSLSIIDGTSDMLDNSPSTSSVYHSWFWKPGIRWWLMF